MSGALWAVGGRLPRPVGDALARGIAPVAALLPLKGVAAWEATIERATGRPPTPRQRRLLIENWLRNTLWSLRLARWTDREVLATIDVSDEDEARLHSSPSRTWARGTSPEHGPPAWASGW